MARIGDDLTIRTPNANMVDSLGGAIAPQTSPLASVPLEVLLHINRHLGTHEYGNLRLTCKHLEDQLFNAFAEEFFGRRQFSITEFGLQALADMSKSRFSSSLKHVMLSLQQPFLNPVSPRSPQPVPLNPADTARRNRLVADQLGHSIFLNTGQHVEMLAQAFSSLPCLETIGMRDFISDFRGRDFPDMSWDFYGARSPGAYGTIMTPRNTRYNGTTEPAADLDHQIFAYRTFHDILRAAGKASLHLEHFEVILRSCALGDRAFIIPKYLEPTVGPVLAHLRTIFLDLSSEPPFIYTEQNNTVAASPFYFLMKFLSRTVKLETLRLNMRTSRSDPLLSWLARSPPTVSASTSVAASPCPEPEPVELKHLRRLDIGIVTLKSEAVLAIYRKYRATLRVISLHKVTLLDMEDAPNDEKINLWARLFKDISKLDLKLDAINTSCLSQVSGSGLASTRARVTFKNNNPSKAWAGNDTQSGLRDFEEQVTVVRYVRAAKVPASVGSNDETSTNSDDDLDDEDEDDEDEDESEDGDTEEDDDDAVEEDDE